ncbi:AraC family transcriptional regulator ligand-binding domain-containing protein [Pseudomonas piscis]|uniref:AraC family transcriptional regulator ligand-binding domain-containing protein n=1 Tax=Pseudomonas piscis TaxID=2614538 RepID=A0ABY9NPL2_9PSED|nr:AraC family transcriptional regulator [Pseudomonas piscis]WMN20291.1 AraC family transcriptional regulator ligand-binding domain-containing protein [Pseudomonas piscis]
MPASRPVGAYVRRLKLSPLLEYLQERQLRLPSPCQARWQGLKPADHIPLDQYLGFFEEAARTLDDPLLGARIGLASRSPVLSPLRELFLNEATLHGALLELNLSTTALQGGTRTQLRIDGEQVQISYQLPAYPARACRQDVEFSLGMLIHVLQLRLGQDWRAQRIDLCHALTAKDREALGGLLDCPVRDAAPSNGIVFASHWLDHRCPGQGCDADVLLFFREHIQGLCAEQHSGSFHERVRRLLEGQLGEQPPSLERIARQLCLSPRSVQRKLALEQVVFSELLEQVRHSLALERMRHPGTRIDELADSLGYADSAAFSKAFKRWTGVPPLRYRRQFL